MPSHPTSRPPTCSRPSRSTGTNSNPPRSSRNPTPPSPPTFFAAATEREARRQFSSLQQAFINLRRGKPGLLPPPVDDIDAVAEPHELAMASHALAITAVGTPEIVENQLRAILDETQPDELIVTGHFYDHAARVRSLEITAQLRDRIAQTQLVA